ncbi:MAG: hypothetical protein Q9204_003600 [Flavoplaca sp. TL-2023a]
MPAKSTKNPGSRVRDTSTTTPKSKSRSKSSQPKASNSSKPRPKPSPQSTIAQKPKPENLQLEAQQWILDVFCTAFRERFGDVERLRADVQRLKGFLYDRDFGRAFGDEDALEAYSVRWSAARAVAYAGLFVEIGELWEGFRAGRDGERGEGRRKVVCLGGGAGAEVVALWGMGMCGGSGQDGEGRNEREDGDDGEYGDRDCERSDGLDIIVVDIAPWSSILSKLSSTITSQPIPTSSESPEATEGPLTPPGKLAVTFKQSDILFMQHPEMQHICHGAKLVTLMFTLNELYSISIAKTTGMLLDLTGCVGRGCVLVVVDSPGSYSTLALGGGKDGKGNDGASKGGETSGEDDVDGEKEKKKRYPMKWLLDHTLLEVARGERGDEGGRKGERAQQWEKVYSEDSRWFRLKEELRYPIALEDMRMQVHVYRRL